MCHTINGACERHTVGPPRPFLPAPTARLQCPPRSRRVLWSCGLSPTGAMAGVPPTFSPTPPCMCPWLASAARTPTKGGGLHKGPWINTRAAGNSTGAQHGHSWGPRFCGSLVLRAHSLNLAAGQHLVAQSSTAMETTGAPSPGAARGAARRDRL